MADKGRTIFAEKHSYSTIVNKLLKVAISCNIMLGIKLMSAFMLDIVGL